MRQGLALVLVALVVTGCGLFGKDEELGPMPLVDFDPSIDIRRMWSVGIGDGSEIPMHGLRPAHRGGIVYAAAADGQVRAVNLDTGRVVWRTETRQPVSAGPGVGSDVVVVGTLEGNVVALDLVTGAQKWTAEVSSEVLSSPAVADGIVVVRSQDGRVFGFRTSDGYRAWVYDQSVPLLTLRGNSAPLIEGGLVFVAFDSGKVVALRPEDGSLVWEEPVAVPEGRTELERIVDIDGPMAIVSADLYVVSYQGLLARLAGNSGGKLWVKQMSSYAGLAAARNQINVTDDEGGVWGVDRLSGGTLWRQDRLLRRQLSAPARHSDTVVVGDFEGYLHWLAEDDGRFVARERAGSAIVSQPLSVGPILIVQTQSGKLVAFRINTG